MTATEELKNLQLSLKCAVLLLNNNCLYACPSFTQYPQFSTLAWLQIQCNSIEQIRSQDVPGSVMWLYASRNKLRNIPDFSAHRLELLWLSHNSVQAIRANYLPGTLKELDLEGNQLTAVPPSLVHLELLEELHLGGNTIEEIQFAALPVSLKSLYLQDNRIRTVDSAASLRNLQRLALHNNSISVLHGLPASLTDILLAKNPLKELRPDCLPSGEMFEVIQKVPQVRGSDLPKHALQQNQIENLRVPPALCFKAGYKAVIHFFESGCSYRIICEAFKDHLNLHADLFEPSKAMCYCEACHVGRKDQEVYERGNPSKLYALPLGWYRFRLVTPARERQLKAFTNWHRAYHGTTVTNLIKIIEVGDLVSPGVRVIGGKKVTEQPGHYDDERKPRGFNTKKVFVTPSVKYAGCQAYAQVHEFHHGQWKFQVQVALQVLIRPECYTVSGETIGAAARQIDPHFDNSELEWSTNEHGSTMIYGLLVKVL